VKGVEAWRFLLALATMDKEFTTVRPEGSMLAVSLACMTASAPGETSILAPKGVKAVVAAAILAKTSESVRTTTVKDTTAVLQEGALSTVS
jgi:hypothetical protein